MATNANGAECQTPYTMRVIHVNDIDALSDKSGLLKSICSELPMMPRESIIQKRIRDPINGVTIMGSSEKKITSPLILLFS